MPLLWTKIVSVWWVLSCLGFFGLSAFAEDCSPDYSQGGLSELLPREWWSKEAYLFIYLFLWMKHQMPFSGLRELTCKSRVPKSQALKFLSPLFEQSCGSRSLEFIQCHEWWWCWMDLVQEQASKKEVGEIRRAFLPSLLSVNSYHFFPPYFLLFRFISMCGCFSAIEKIPMFKAEYCDPSSVTYVQGRL